MESQTVIHNFINKHAQLQLIAAGWTIRGLDPVQTGPEATKYPARHYFSIRFVTTIKQTCFLRSLETQFSRPRLTKPRTAMKGTYL
jgi:hypothetical protein